MFILAGLGMKKGRNANESNFTVASFMLYGVSYSVSLSSKRFRRLMLTISLVVPVFRTYWPLKSRTRPFEKRPLRSELH